MQCDTCFKKEICKYYKDYLKNYNNLSTDFKSPKIKITFYIKCGYYLRGVKK